MAAPDTGVAPPVRVARETKRHRLAVVTSHVIQYQDPLFRRLAEHPRIDLTVLFGSRMGLESYLDRDLGVTLKWDLEMLHGYEHRFLRNWLSVQTGFWRLVNPGIVKEISRARYDAVLIMGWGSATTWLAFAACRLKGIPILLNGDSSFVPTTRGLRERLRARILRALFRRVSGFMLMGTMNGDFYAHYGADRRRFYLMPYAIDNDRFQRESKMSGEERRAVRAANDIEEDDVAFIFSGKLIARKNPTHLLEAVARMRHRDRAAVVFMGDGAERQHIEARARSLGLQKLRMLGFVNQTAAPRTYAMCDVMVLPSSLDPRGTVVNEAMACGLPIVISDMVGIYGEGDILRSGENGFVYPVGDIDALAKALDALAESETLRRRMGMRSLEIIRGWSYESDVDGVLSALDHLPGNDGQVGDE